MSTYTRKNLGQAAPLATTETDVYECPANTYTVVSTILVANRSATPCTCRLTHSVGGGATATKDYIFPDVTIGGNDVFEITTGICMSPGDIIRAYASTNTISVNIYGEEKT